MLVQLLSQVVTIQFATDVKESRRLFWVLIGAFELPRAASTGGIVRGETRYRGYNRGKDRECIVRSIVSLGISGLCEEGPIMRFLDHV